MCVSRMCVNRKRNGAENSQGKKYIENAPAEELKQANTRHLAPISKQHPKHLTGPSSVNPGEGNRDWGRKSSQPLNKQHRGSKTRGFLLTPPKLHPQTPKLPEIPVSRVIPPSSWVPQTQTQPNHNCSMIALSKQKCKLGVFGGVKDGQIGGHDHLFNTCSTLDD